MKGQKTGDLVTIIAAIVCASSAVIVISTAKAQPADGRNIGESRSETITGGTNTSAPLSFGSDGCGLGQYIIAMDPSAHQFLYWERGHKSLHQRC